MRRLIAFMHVSLDGFVAGPNGEMDWIQVNQELFDHVGKRIGTGDVSMYGRITYNMMENYWPTAGSKPNASKHDIQHSQWYAKVHKVVLSRTLAPESLSNTSVISDNVKENINRIKQSGTEDILLFGSPSTAHALMKEDLIDGYWLFVNPIVLGKGIPVFTENMQRANLKLLSTKQFECGVVELNYYTQR